MSACLAVLSGARLLLAKEGSGKSEGERGRAWLFSFIVIRKLVSGSPKKGMLSRKLEAIARVWLWRYIEAETSDDQMIRRSDDQTIR